MAATTLPKEISKLGSEVKLFGKWDTHECVAPPSAAQKSGRLKIMEKLMMHRAASR